MKIIVTGFDPFDNEKINPSYEAVKILPESIKGAVIIKAELPTEFGRAGELLVKMIRRELPDAVICVGQAGGRKYVTPERIAINVKDARIPDNRGEMPVDLPIFENEREAYFTTLPIREITGRINGMGIPAMISNSAGTFVCNELMYTLLRELELENRGAIGGFIHIPYLPEQVKGKDEIFSLELSSSAKALKATIEATVDYINTRV